MHRRTTQVIPGLLVIAALVTGCAIDEPGRPTAGDTTTTTTSGDPPSSTTEDDGLPSHGAPAVADSLDTSAFEQSPCQMLTDEQVQQAGLVPPGDPSDGPAGPSCAWRNADTQASARTGFETVTRRGLSAAYQANDNGKYDLWVELPEIDGYPAVVASVLDRRAQGDCALVIGTSDDVSFDLAVTLSRAKVGQTDPCEAAQAVAKLVLQTMKS